MKTHKARFFFSLLIFLSSSLFPSESLFLASTIERTAKQQVLASLPPSHETTTSGSSQLFVTSPSGEYAAYLRRETSNGAGGLGSDFCYIQVRKGSVSIWMSTCASVSKVNTCSLVFQEVGLGIFDGTKSAWNTKVSGEHLEKLDLLDSGDLQIRNQEHKVVWKARDNPTTNQNCGSIESRVLVPALSTPSTAPISNEKTSSAQPFNSQEGQSEDGYQGEQEASYPQQGMNQPLSGFNQPFSSTNQPLSGFNQPFSSNNQPLSGPNQPYSSRNQPFGSYNQQGLGNNSPFDNGVLEEKPFLLGVVLASLIMFGFLA